MRLSTDENNLLLEGKAILTYSGQGRAAHRTQRVALNALGSAQDARLSRSVAGPRRGASRGLRVLGCGHDHRV
jgi:hypothetical protein